MMFEYVQTWMIREGFEEAHDELMRTWILRMGDDPSLTGIRWAPSHNSLPRKRVLVYLFESVENWRLFRKDTLVDWRVFVGQWLPYIDVGSYKVYFWNKGEYYGE